MNGHFHARLIYLLFTHIKYAKLLSVRKTSVKTRVAIAAPTRPPPPPPPHRLRHDVGSTGIFLGRLFYFFPRFGEERFDIETSGVADDYIIINVHRS